MRANRPPCTVVMLSWATAYYHDQRLHAKLGYNHPSRRSRAGNRGLSQRHEKLLLPKTDCKASGPRLGRVGQSDMGAASEQGLWEDLAGPVIRWIKIRIGSENLTRAGYSVRVTQHGRARYEKENIMNVLRLVPHMFVLNKAHRGYINLDTFHMYRGC